MRSASDQLAKHTAFDQMRNVWPDARTFSRMLSAFDHRNSNLLPLMNCTTHLAIGAREARMSRDNTLTFIEQLLHSPMALGTSTSFNRRLF